MEYEKSIDVNGKVFIVQCIQSDNKNAVARVRENTITIKIPRRWPHNEKLSVAQSLEKRIISQLLNPKTKINPLPEMNEQQKHAAARARLPDVVTKVQELNAVHFQSQLGRIRIRHNLTNWGSCSTKNNISLNFVLLFLPTELLDYVIVHELAHTKIRNHSQRFWQFVERVIPGYKNRKRELKKYSLTN